MSIALITEGTYPVAEGGVSVWCHELITGLSGERFSVHAIVATPDVAPAYELPGNVDSLTYVPLAPEDWEPFRRRRAGTRAWRDFVACVTSPDLDVAGFTRALLAVRRAASRSGIDAVVASTGALEELLRALADAHRALPVPAASVRDGLDLLALFRHLLRPLEAPLPSATVLHATAAGLAGMVGLVAAIEQGVPLVVTEHGVYLRERYLQLADERPVVKWVSLRFFELLARATYRHADLLAPCSEYNRRWELRLGAPPERIRVIYNGVDPDRFPRASSEPARPTLAWVGRVDPLKDLETLLRAVGELRDEQPVHLRLFGGTPQGNEGYRERCARLVDDLGLGDAVSFEGPVRPATRAYSEANVVVLSSISEGFPYTVVEAMMVGRAVVATDVGGVREAVGDAGVVVPPRDPAQLAAACAELLRDAERRSHLGSTASERARAMFTAQLFLGRYGAVYRSARARASAP